MKELSIEEKAKRYDEALEKAKDYHKQLLDEDNPEWASEIEKIFPELKESDDERIRKELISYLDNFTNSEDRELVDKFIAWLEKQVPACLSHDDEIMIRQLTEYFTTGKGLQNINDTVVEWLADVKRKLEKQGEQKPNTVLDIEIPFGAKDSELQEVTYYIPKGFHAEIDDDKVVIKKGEKSTTWSEEDEKIALSIEQVMNCASLLNIVPEKVDKIRTWLKSLKDRVQPKHEWSKEDIYTIENIDSVLFYDKDLPEDTCVRLRNWLKSLKDRVQSQLQQ